jgi:hypothetical protein
MQNLAVQFVNQRRAHLPVPVETINVALKARAQHRRLKIVLITQQQSVRRLPKSLALRRQQVLLANM